MHSNFSPYHTDECFSLSSMYNDMWNLDAGLIGNSKDPFTQFDTSDSRSNYSEFNGVAIASRNNAHLRDFEQQLTPRNRYEADIPKHDKGHRSDKAV